MYSGVWGKNLFSTILTRGMITFFVFGTIIYDLDAQEYHPGRDDCNSIRNLIYINDIDNAIEKVVSKPNLRKCSVLLIKYYHEHGQIKKAKEIAAIGKKYMDRNWMRFYYDAIYYCILLGQLSDEEINTYFYDLKGHNKKIADALSKKLTEEIAPKFKKCMENPWENDCGELNAFWLRNAGVNTDSWKKFIHNVDVYKKHRNVVKNDAVVQKIYQALDNLKNIELIFDVHRYSAPVHELLQVYKLYSEYFDFVNKARTVQNNNRKAELFHRAYNEFIAAKTLNNGRDPNFFDSERAYSFGIYHRLIAEIETYFSTNDASIPPPDMIAEWRLKNDLLGPQINLDTEYITTLQLFEEFYNLQRYGKYELQCPDELLAFFKRPVWDMHFIGKKQMNTFLKQEYLETIQNKSNRMLHDIEKHLRNEPFDTYDFSDLDVVKGWIQCLSSTYSDFIDTEKTDELQMICDNLIEFEKAKSNSDGKNANTILKKIPNYIKMSRKLKPIVDCASVVAEIRAIVEGQAGEYKNSTLIERLKIVSKIPYDNDDWNLCLNDATSGFPDIIVELKGHFFREEMKLAFEKFNSNELDEGIEILNEFLSGEYYPVGNNEYMYIYASEKRKLLEKLSENQGLNGLRIHFDNKVTEDFPRDQKYTFFTGENLLVETIQNKEKNEAFYKKSERDIPQESMPMATAPPLLADGDGDKKMQPHDSYSKIKQDSDSWGEIDERKIFDLCFRELVNKNFSSAQLCFSEYIKDHRHDQKARGMALMELSAYLSVYYQNDKNDRSKLNIIIKNMNYDDLRALSKIFPELETARTNLQPTYEEHEGYTDFDWENLVKTGENFISNFEYRLALDHFRKYSSHAETQGNTIWKQREKFAQALFNCEKKAREIGQSSKGLRVFRSEMRNQFYNGPLKNSEYYYNSHPYTTPPASVVLRIKDVHKKHMTFIFWIAFADARFEQRRFHDAWENANLALKFAQTPKEKEFASKHIDIYSSHIANSKPKAQKKEPTKPLQSLLSACFQSIHGLTERALEERLENYYIDKTLKTIDNAGKNVKSNDLNKFADQISYELHNTIQAILGTYGENRTSRKIIARIRAKIRMMEWWKKSDNNLENKVKLKRIGDF